MLKYCDDVEWLAVQFEFTIHKLARIEQVVDEALQELKLILHRSSVLDVLLHLSVAQYVTL